MVAADRDGALTLKLHATLVNSKRGRGGGGGRQPRPTFDARPLLALPARTDVICEVPLAELHLSRMQGPPQEDGYYGAAHVLSLL